MKLVFIHGWGLDATMWNGVSALLPEFEQERVDLGFFDRGQGPGARGQGNILIGHSLGFAHGLAYGDSWRGWIAINSFPRFVKTENKIGCVAAAELRDMRKRLAADAEKTLQGFRQMIGALAPSGKPNIDRLRAGLDALRDADIADKATQISPGFVIASSHDPLVPVAASESLAEGKDILWHEKGGHMLPQKEPVFCAGAIRRFMEQHDFNRA